MNSKQAIIDKIINDAKTHASEIAQQAEAKAQEINAEAKRQAEAIMAKAERERQRALQSIEDNSKVVANLDCKKALLTARANLVAEVFESAIEKLRKSDKDYLDIVAKMIESQAEDGDVVCICESDSKIITEKFVKEIAKKLKINLTLSDRRADIKGGVILEGVNYDKNLSLDLEIAGMKEQAEAEIASILFKE